jgi:diketogulonate reductase-like aldo/keto reductase
VCAWTCLELLDATLEAGGGKGGSPFTQSCRTVPIADGPPFLVVWQELLEDATAAEMTVMAYCPLAHGSSQLLRDPTLAMIASARGKTPAQVALRWSVQRGLVPIPKASSATRLRENLGALEFELSAADMASLNGLEANDRYSFDPRNIA